MKKYLFLLSLLIISCNDNKTTDLDVNQLNGNVASVKISTYEADSKFGEIVKGDLEYNGVSIIEFNESGYITSTSVFESNGELYSKSKYFYKEEKLDYVVGYNAEGDLEFKTVHNWDNNELLSVIHYDKDGKEICRDTYEYENEKQKSYSFYYEDELETKGIVTKYHGKICLESIEYDKNGKEKGKKINEWKNGKIVKTEYISYKESSCSSYSISYNENGYTKKSENCYILSNTIHLNDGTYYYEYEFDDKDNWIKCIIFKGDSKKPYLLIEREIYYK